MVVIRKNLDERARRKPFDAIFNYNHNGKNNETNNKDITMFYIGKLFIKDFVDELEMQDLMRRKLRRFLHMLMERDRYYNFAINICYKSRN